MRAFTLLVSSCTVAALLAAAAPATSSSSYRSGASWYGPGLYGNGMACGGRLEPSTWGVANRTLPCGTRLAVCYARCVHVTVRDRGPYVAGRDFDLTWPVKQAIGMPSTGVVRWWRL